MNQVIDFFIKLFDPSDWPSRQHCGNWTTFHMWLFILSELLISSSSFFILFVIYKSPHRKINSKRNIYLIPGILMLCFSFTHLLNAITFQYPLYRLSTFVNLITGLIGWISIYSFIKIIALSNSSKRSDNLEKEVEERKKTEEQLLFTNKLLNDAQSIAKLGYWQWDVITNNVIWSSQMYHIYGIEEGKPIDYEEFLSLIHPSDRALVNNSIMHAFHQKVFSDYIHRIVLPNGTEKVLQARGEVVLDNNGNVIRMLGTGQDVTLQQKAQQELIEKTKQLEVSNEELQRFAYIASHDLQEPLRKILTFSSLLDKEPFDEKLKNYVSKMVFASQRMQRLIEDILQFSLLRMEHQDFSETDLNLIIKEVLLDLEIQIEQANARISLQSELPNLYAIPSQLRQLFQNIISNAIKFSKVGIPPQVYISSEMNFGNQLELNTINQNGYLWPGDIYWIIKVSDNGIGFDNAYCNKIFDVFQRLHSKDKFDGTGIGLAICKRVIENHKGFIKAESTPGIGTTFTIILPSKQHEQSGNI